MNSVSKQIRIKEKCTRKRNAKIAAKLTKNKEITCNLGVTEKCSLDHKSLKIESKHQNETSHVKRKVETLKTFASKKEKVRVRNAEGVANYFLNDTMND